MRVRTVREVVRGEGLAAAFRRAADRLEESARRRALLGAARSEELADVLNVSMYEPASRYGGVQTQLRTRLDEERRRRPVALLYPGCLELRAHAVRAPHFAPTFDERDTQFEEAVESAANLTGAKVLHLEGTAGVPLGSLLTLGSRLGLVLSVHDFSMLDARSPHPSLAALDRIGAEPDEHRRNARALLEAARAVVFPSSFLLEAHRRHFGDEMQAIVVEPGAEGARIIRGDGARRRVAICGSVRTYKGAELIESIVAATDRDLEWHVFGGGDSAILERLRALGLKVHGYYRRGSLPRLLAREGIGLALLLSVVPESFSLTLSECWLSGAPVIAFDIGAIGERIQRDGGGWLVPLCDGASGIAAKTNEWRAGRLGDVTIPMPPTVADAAGRMMKVYEEL